MPISSGKYSTTAESAAPWFNPAVVAAPLCPTYWTYIATSPPRMQIDISLTASMATSSVWPLTRTMATAYNYSPTKTYQMITNVNNTYATAASFSTAFAWNDQVRYPGGATVGVAIPLVSAGVSHTQSYFNYSSPPTSISTISLAILRANRTFTGPNRGILDVKVNEIDFNILGFSYYKLKSIELTTNPYNSNGWYFDKDTKRYFWFDYISGSASNISNTNYFAPIGGSYNTKSSNVGYRLNNCIYKIIPYSFFNFSFNYYNPSPFPLKIYLSPSAPSTAPASLTNLINKNYVPPAGSLLLATLTQSMSGTYSSTNYYIPSNFYGTRGNQYLMFVGGFAGLSASVSGPGPGATYAAIYLENITIEGGYHPGNNRQYVTNNYFTYSYTTGFTSTYSVALGLTGATFSALVGSGNTVNATQSLISPGINRIYSKIGNGKFNSGVWENGVWNSGWRVDEQMYEFYNITQYFNYNKAKRWRIQINGPTSSVDKFNIGDIVSISNLVTIDINENRRLNKGYYTIINKTSNTIIVEFDSDFPLRRIQRDSDYHRMQVTKNVWLSGGFLNGYFTGIWNYGLFRGYPLITEMFDTQWIDGVFDGGHFSTEQISIPPFVDTIYHDTSRENLVIQQGLEQYAAFSVGKVGLTFSSPHGLVVNDVINIDKTNKNINPQYDGEHKIIKVVNDYEVITDIDWGSDSSNEGGQVTIELSSGLVQKMTFKSNNLSKITSSLSMVSNAVFIYNSWMDVVYNSDSATNIGKPQSVLNSLSRRSYSENNLYGYITNDILESESNFRDSYSLTNRKYRLGTKYKIFADFIGDSGNFEDEFGGTFSDAETSFLKYGWTFSRITAGNLTFSRTTEIETTDIIGNELKVNTVSSGGILDIATPTIEVQNREIQEIQKLRYTKVEFDLITFSSNVSINAPYAPHIPYYYLYSAGISTLYAPAIHFNNLNYVNRYVNSGNATFYVPVDAKYLPIYQNVNHLTTTKRTKVEYFYNKRNLSMHFYGFANGNTLPIDYTLDKLHFYEVDMIPFFSYFTEENINRGIMIPYQGVSPFIDYTNSNFSFIDNISIGLDSIQTQNSNTVVSGVGFGIGSNLDVTSVGSGGTENYEIYIGSGSGYSGKATS